jgi:hypothetical protein
MAYRRTTIFSFPRAELMTSVLGLIFLPVLWFPWCLLFNHSCYSLLKAACPEQLSDKVPRIGPKCISTMSGPRSKGSYQCSRALPKERPRKPISPDRYGLFYQVTGSVHHSQSCFNTVQFLLPLRSSAGAT